MADLKFIGINVGTVNVQRQASQTADALLINTVRPSGGASGPLVINPSAAVTGTDRIFEVRDGSGNTRFFVTGAGDATVANDLTVTGDLTVSGTALVSAGPSNVNGSITFGDDDTDTVTMARGWVDGTDLSYASSLILDPNDSPTFGTNGAVHLVIGSGVSPAANGTNGTYNPPAGSLMLQTNGTAWIKTGAGATAWSQLTTGSGITSLQDAYTNGQTITTSSGAVAITKGLATDEALSVTTTDSNSSALAEFTRTSGTGSGALVSVSNSSATATGIGVDVAQASSQANAFGLRVAMSAGGSTTAAVQATHANASSDVMLVGSTTTGLGFRPGSILYRQALSIAAAGASTSGAGVGVTVTGQSGLSAAAGTAGGGITVTGGAGGAGSSGIGGAGANIVLTGGAGGNASAAQNAGVGGTIQIFGGAGGGGAGNAGAGGNVEIDAGATAAGAASGSVLIGTSSTRTAAITSGHTTSNGVPWSHRGTMTVTHPANSGTPLSLSTASSAGTDELTLVNMAVTGAGVNVSALQIRTGTQVPTATAPARGSLYLRTGTGSGGSVYVKTGDAGSSGWTQLQFDIEDAVAVDIPIENGVTIAAGEVVGASATAGRCTRANGTGNANSNVLGIAVSGGTGNVGGSVTARVVTAGRITDAGATFTQGILYLGAAGRPVNTPLSSSGDAVVRIGYAYSATEYVIHVGEVLVIN
jgi:hypothetical protein